MPREVPATRAQGRRLYRPACAAVLTAPVFGASREKAEQAAGLDAVNVPIRVFKATLGRNDHNTADTLSISTVFEDAGVDPRLVGAATIKFYMGQANDDGDFIPSAANYVFAGICVKATRKTSEAGSFVDLEFHDFTSLFLKSKPFPASGQPHYSMNLEEAWRLVCDNTGWRSIDAPRIHSSVAALKDRLEFRGELADGPPPLISKAAVPRLAKLSHVQLKPNEDSWAVWQRCVGLCGLISFIEIDRCVVVTSTDYYAKRSPPALVWGKNIVDYTETRNTDASDKGVCVTSYNPLTGTTLEAFWPLPSMMAKRPPRAPNLPASVRNSPHGAVDADRYDFYEYGGVTDPDRLSDIAKRAWEERSRQQLQGSLTTAEMAVGTADGASMVDLLTLGAGQSILVKVGDFEREQLIALSDEKRRISFLVERGYTTAAATLIAKNADSLSQLDSVFFTKAVTVTLETNKDGGAFSVTIDYQNRIKIDGSATP